MIVFTKCKTDVVQFGSYLFKELLSVNIFVCLVFLKPPCQMQFDASTSLSMKATVQDKGENALSAHQGNVRIARETGIIKSFSHGLSISRHTNLTKSSSSWTKTNAFGSNDAVKSRGVAFQQWDHIVFAYEKLFSVEPTHNLQNER